MKVLRAGALGVLSQAFIPDLLIPLDRSVNKQGNPALSSQVIPLVLAEKADALSNAESLRAEQSSRRYAVSSGCEDAKRSHWAAQIHHPTPRLWRHPDDSNASH